MVKAKMRPLFLCSVILYHGNNSSQQLLNMLRNLFQKQENVLIGLRILQKKKKYTIVQVHVKVKNHGCK